MEVLYQNGMLFTLIETRMVWKASDSHRYENRYENDISISLRSKMTSYCVKFIQRKIIVSLFLLVYVLCILKSPTLVSNVDLKGVCFELLDMFPRGILINYFEWVDGLGA